MGDIGMSEVLVLAVMMLLVMGPEQMVRMMREVGYWLRRVQRLANNMRIVLVDELEKAEQAARPDGTLPGTGGAKSLSDITGKNDSGKDGDRNKAD